MGDIIRVPIKMQSDEKGYIDRECPNEECLFNFKIKLDDWKEKVSDDEVHCPMCGHIDTSDKWWTQQQLDDIRKIAADYAVNYMTRELDKALKGLEKALGIINLSKSNTNQIEEFRFLIIPLGKVKNGS